MRNKLTFALVLTVLGIGASSAKAQTAFALSGNGTTLIRFDVSSPGTVVTVGNFSGGATALDAIDFRPLNGLLYGYHDATDTLYTINPTTAVLTAVASGSGASATNTGQLGLDFNPTIDRVRVVTENAQNLVYNPNNANPPTVATNLFYGAGDPNFGATPRVAENAYTGNVAGSGFSTVQFGIDYNLDSLVTIANNAGTLTTIGSLGVNATTFTGFDVYTTTVGANFAYAILGDFTTPTFYIINTSTGAASAVGAVGSGLTGVRGLAVMPAMAPEPGTLLLLALGSLAAWTVRRRRKA